MTDDDLNRYSRHVLLNEIDVEGQARIMASTALVVGCGGLGHAAVAYLAASGIGHLALVDFDEVETSNLPRQIGFDAHDVGRSKVQALAAKLRRTHPAIKLTAIHARLHSADHAALVRQCSVLLDCSDNYATRQQLNRLSQVFRKPLVSGAADRFDGQVAVFDPRQPDSPCYACLFHGEHADDSPCAKHGVYAPLVGMVGSLQASEAVKLAAGIGASSAGMVLHLHALNFGITPLRLQRHPHCPVCGAPQAGTDMHAAVQAEAIAP